MFVVPLFQEPHRVAIARALVRQLLIYDPQLRATVHDARTSSWVACEINELERLYDRRILSVCDF